MESTLSLVFQPYTLIGRFCSRESVVTKHKHQLLIAQSSRDGYKENSNTPGSWRRGEKPQSSDGKGWWDDEAPYSSKPANEDYRPRITDNSYGQEFSDSKPNNGEGASEIGESLSEVPDGSSTAPSAAFSRSMKDANSLYLEGRKGISGKLEVGVAEEMFRESITIFRKAMQQPLPVEEQVSCLGQCGNALLAFGELKLKAVQQLRSVIWGRVGASNSGDDVEDENEYESLSSYLNQVSIDCEDLLVEAGRMYRSALNLQPGDVRSLFNWGLALCFRGQLVMEEELEGCEEAAEQLFLAAIDKFEAMVSNSDDGRFTGLLNWGLVLRERSRLRPLTSPSRLSLLEQSLALIEEAERESDVGDVREVASREAKIGRVELNSVREAQGEANERRRRGSRRVDDSSRAEGSGGWWT